MNIKEIFNHMKEMKNNGDSRDAIYHQYKDKGPGEKRIACMVASLPDKKLSSDYQALKLINIIVVVLMCIPFTKAILFFNSDNYIHGFIHYLGVVSIGIAFPILSAISFYMNRSQGFFNFIYMSALFLGMSVLVIKKERYGVDLIYISGFIYCLLAVILTTYTKSKLFPSLTFFGSVKRDSNGSPIFD